MKKMTLVSLGIVTFSTLVLGGGAFASEEQPAANSEASVLFKADDDKTTPPVVVPPTGEDKPGAIDPDGSDGSIGDGLPSFNIAYVSNFRFNERTAADTDFTKFEPIKLNANGMTLWAKGTQLTLKELDKDGNLVTPEVKSVYQDIPNFVQVVDNRGKNSGWNLSVVAGEFKGKDAEGKEATLTGAQLSLNQATVKGPADVTAPSLGFTNSTVINKSSKVLLNAQANAGTGSWSLKFGQEEKQAGAAYETLVADTGVKLDIPASAQAKADVAYKADINWTLTDAPAN